MSRKAYLSVTKFFEQTKERYFLLFVISRVIPWIIAGIYGVICIFTAIAWPERLLRFAGVPLAAFLAVTGARILIRRQRPYETFDFTPITFQKEPKKGKSFPSRHTASAAVISMACLAFEPQLGVIVLGMAVLVAVSRILCGVHYISDVAAGFAFGIIVGIIGFYPIIF